MPSTRPCLSDAQRVVVRHVWNDVLHGRRTMLAALDRLVDRDLDADVLDVLRCFEPGFVRFDPHGSMRTEVACTVIAFHALDDPTVDYHLQIFVELLRLLVDVERDYTPDPTSPFEDASLTSREAAARFAAMDLPSDPRRLLPAFVLMQIEGLAASSSGPNENHAWQISVNRMIRAMRGVRSVDDYLRRVATRKASPVQSPSSPLDARSAPRANPVGARVFILMPFGPPWADRVHGVIQEACYAITQRGVPLSWQRADDIAAPGSVTEQILSAISSADVIVADLSDLNSNVVFELGYAHALSKPVVAINQNVEALPFDLKDWRQVPYQLSILAALKSRLVSSLESALHLESQ